MNKIALSSLKIGAIKLRPVNPVKWTSGYYMPIYINNRERLSYPDLREENYTSFENIIKDNNIIFDYVAGVPTAGLAPAAGFANKYGHELIFEHEGKICKFKKVFNLKDYEAEVVASTAPISIIPGVEYADKTKKPFIYVRETRKQHGLEQQIEGVLKKGSTVFLLDYYTSDSYFENACKAIEAEEGIITEFLSGEAVLEEVNITGKTVLLFEDHVSLAGSSEQEAGKYREHRGIVENLISITNYGFPEARENFRKARIQEYTVLWYDDLIETAKNLPVEQGGIKKEHVEMLKKWRLDAWNWGEKHGLPKDS